MTYDDSKMEDMGPYIVRMYHTLEDGGWTEKEAHGVPDSYMPGTIISD